VDIKGEKIHFSDEYIVPDIDNLKFILGEFSFYHMI
jgi:hypothetical protein